MLLDEILKQIVEIVMKISIGYLAVMENLYKISLYKTLINLKVFFTRMSSSSTCWSLVN